MPLARILTAFPERAETLAQQLRDQGYTVEFTSPEKAGLLRADLEIDFEVCEQSTALRRAAELAARFNADIAVSTGALESVSGGAGTAREVVESHLVETAPF